MDVEAGLTAEQKNAGYVLPCVSRAERNGCVGGLIRFHVGMNVVYQAPLSTAQTQGFMC